MNETSLEDTPKNDPSAFRMNLAWEMLTFLAERKASHADGRAALAITAAIIEGQVNDALSSLA